MERWVCPFCNFAQIIGDDSKQTDHVNIALGGALPSQTSYATHAYGCTNPQCRRISLSLDLHGFVYNGTQGRQKKYFTTCLLPRSSSKPQPDYIPYALREDYDEACAIRDLSPKAAATLVRRCLQGMIRDFCTITDKRTLNDEIQALKKLVDEGKAPSGVTEESVEAIDQVRGIGNIGAHMEKDIDLIVDVDPNEAQVLIELVEMLFEEWYVARHQRHERLARIKKIAETKQEAKNGDIPASSNGEAGIRT
jgi:Domain of unknown function (DUF4145)